MSFKQTNNLYNDRNESCYSEHQLKHPLAKANGNVVCFYSKW